MLSKFNVKPPGRRPVGRPRFTSKREGNNEKKDLKEIGRKVRS